MSGVNLLNGSGESMSLSPAAMIRIVGGHAVVAETEIPDVRGILARHDLGKRASWSIPCGVDPETRLEIRKILEALSLLGVVRGERRKALEAAVMEYFAWIPRYS